MITALSRLRVIGLVEGVTLLLLLFVAVPLKRLGGVPEATAIMGPVHGLALIAYVVTLLESISAGGWSKAEALRAGLACLMPFGTFLNDRSIRARLKAT